MVVTEEERSQVEFVERIVQDKVTAVLRRDATRDVFVPQDDNLIYCNSSVSLSL
jgi:hypothetical protein